MKVVSVVIGFLVTACGSTSPTPHVPTHPTEARASVVPREQSVEVVRGSAPEPEAVEVVRERPAPEPEAEVLAPLGPAPLSLSPPAAREVCGFALPCRLRRRREREPETGPSLEGYVQAGGRSVAFEPPSQRMHPSFEEPSPAWVMVSAPGEHDLRALDAAVSHTNWHVDRGMLMPSTQPPRSPIEGLTRDGTLLVGFQLIQSLSDRGERIHVLTHGSSRRERTPDMHHYGYYDGEWHVSTFQEQVAGFGISGTGQPWFVFANGELRMPDGTRRDLAAETGVPRQHPLTSRPVLGLFEGETRFVLVHLNHRLVLIRVDASSMTLHPVAISESAAPAHGYAGPMRRRQGLYASAPRIPIHEHHSPLQLIMSTEGLVVLYARYRTLGRIWCDDEPFVDRPGRFELDGRSCSASSAERLNIALIARRLQADGTLSDEVVLLPDQDGLRMAAEYNDGGLTVTVSPGYDGNRISRTRLSPP